jgi:ActR/RegA family two-component response regulator
MASGKILIVDDLPDWRVTLSGLFMDQGYDVQAASSNNSALHILENDYFHVAVLDIRLDESDEDNRDGLLLMHQIKERWPSIDIIILTGFADISMAQEALNPNPNGSRLAYSFLEKTQTDLLIERVKQALEHSVHFLITQGENENVEFRSTIRWDYQNKKTDKKIQKAIARTIAGMMNNTGGTLFIGVADDGKILGIEKDLFSLRKQNVDEFEKVLVEIIQNYLGIEYIKYVDIRFESFDEKIVCLISIETSSKPVFLVSENNSEFWVRIRNSTRQMSVKDATEYIQTHWVEKQ